MFQFYSCSLHFQNLVHKLKVVYEVLKYLVEKNGIYKGFGIDMIDI